MYENNRKDKEEYEKKPIFKDAIVLMVSLLHGNLFFILAGNTIELINDFSFYGLSQLLFDYAVFLRVFQTHILAAIKYDNKWAIKPLDYIWLFCTAMFEYILFNSKAINSWNSNTRNYVIMWFCIVGSIGYYLTYSRTKKQFDNDMRKAEMIIQSTNIAILIIVGIVHFTKAKLNIEDSIPNYLCTTWIVINIYYSIKNSHL